MEALPSLTEFLRFAESLARLGGGIARSYFGRVSATRKSDASLVTEADHAVQHAILSEIARAYPDHAVLGEETIARPEAHRAAAHAEYCWVIDPIDGTRNFARGVETYVTSVGLLHRGSPVAAALYDPPRDRLFAARLGGGATQDGRPLSTGDRPIDTDTTLALSTLNGRPLTPRIQRWMETFVFRNAGSLCMHLIWVAQGQCDGAYSTQAKLWDIAAAALLVTEAGGRVTDLSGHPLWPIDVAIYAGQDVPLIAATRTMHDRLIRSIASE